ncbi:unnamed protein product, partial [Leptidea sinapis]
MAELVNQRIEATINELEQMRRTELYDDEELREIARKRKEFEYRIQRRLKEKDDYVQYIAYELALLEDITYRRKQIKMHEKLKDIEYAIAKRLNKVFKQFIMRYQDDVEIYFEYIKFCKAVKFDFAAAAIIGQMLQIHGDKPKTWLLASLYETKVKNSIETSRSFLLKGIHRHPESEELYRNLFEVELKLAFSAETDDEKDKCIKRAEVVWRNGVKNIPDLKFLFQICDIALTYDNETVMKSLKEEIWSKRDNKDVWSYIAMKELQGFHWEQIDDTIDTNHLNFSKELNNFVVLHEKALEQFPDEKLCTEYIHKLLGLNDSICTDLQKIAVVKRAWEHGHANGLLTNDMYSFGFTFLRLEDELTTDEFMQILDTALVKNPKSRVLWEEKLLLSKDNENKMLSILQDADKTLRGEDLIYLWNFMLDNIKSNVVFRSCYKKFQACENAIALSLKPKLLQKLYEHNGLKTAREVYENFVRTPPTQKELHKVMINIELAQEKPSLKHARKYYECLVHHHGSDHVDVWLEYISFETNMGNVSAIASIHRRAIAQLKKDIVDDFIKAQAIT